MTDAAISPDRTVVVTRDEDDPTCWLVWEGKPNWWGGDEPFAWRDDRIQRAALIYAEYDDSLLAQDVLQNYLRARDRKRSPMTVTPYLRWDYDSYPDVPLDMPDDAWQDVLSSFRAAPRHPSEVTLLVSYYSYEDYYGAAFVLYWDKKVGRWFEVNGGHCSCYGLEGQWEPEETTLAAVMARTYIADGQTTTGMIRETVQHAIDAGWEDGPK